MTQRNAQRWCLVATGTLLLAMLGSGCMPMGANSRRMAMNRQFNAEMQRPGQRSPADMARPTSMQESQLAADPRAPQQTPAAEANPYPFDPSAANAPQSMRNQVASRQRALGDGSLLDSTSPTPPGAQAPMPIPGEGQVAPVTWQTQDGSTVPVAQASATQPLPAGGAHASLCDGNCQHGAHGQVAGPDGVIGLPAFRFPEMPEPSLLPGEENNAAPAAAPVATAQPERPAAQNPPASPQPESAQATAPRTVQIIPSATPMAPPVAPPPAAPASAHPPASSRRVASNPAGQAPAASPPRKTGESPAAPSERPLPASVTMSPVRTTMQVRVTEDTATPAATPMASARAPQPGLPAPAAAPAMPPTRNSSSAKPVQNPAAPSPSAQSASPAGIRVDSSLKSPWSQPAPSATPPAPSAVPPSNSPTPPADSSQPAARILPFNPPAQPARNNATSSFSPPPPSADMQVRPASHQQPGTAAASPASPIPTTLASPPAPSREMSQTALQVASVFNGMPLITNPPGSASSQSPRQPSATQRAAAMPALRASRPALTNEIRGFGDYEPMPSPALVPGQTVLVYCELENFVSSPAQQNGTNAFRTMLESRLVVTDPSGRVVQDSRFPPLDDYAASRRAEFFMYVPFEVGQLPAGSYQAQLEVRDMQGTSTRTAPVAFSVR